MPHRRPNRGNQTLMPRMKWIVCGLWLFSGLVARLSPVKDQSLDLELGFQPLTKAIALKKLISKASFQASGSLFPTVATGSKTPWLMINPSIFPNSLRVRSTVSCARLNWAKSPVMNCTCCGYLDFSSSSGALLRATATTLWELCNRCSAIARPMPTFPSETSHIYVPVPLPLDAPVTITIFALIMSTLILWRFRTKSKE